MDKPLIVLYSKPGCHLCERALELLLEMRREIEFELREMDITTDRQLFEEYFDKIPVIVVDDRILFYAPIHAADLKRALVVVS